MVGFGFRFSPEVTEQPQRTADIQGELVATQFVTDLNVKLLVAEATVDGAAKHYRDPELYQYQINLECNSTRSDTLGYVYAWDFTVKEWVLASPYISGENNTSTSDEASQPYYSDPLLTDHAVRRSFTISRKNGSAQRFVDTNGLMLVKLVQLNGSSFTSSYDLLQVIPYLRPAPIGSCTICLTSLQADANYDGVTDESDLVRFLDKWIEGHPAADTDMDEVVDDADLTKFLTDYAREAS